MESNYKLTQYSRGAGCGCKIAPQVLQEILGSTQSGFQDPNLLVGNSTNDDAAAWNLGNGQALITTTDFFMPIVDDAFDFGRVAAANAISDVYAMGGTPIIAIAILGWPVEKLPASLAQQVLEGARNICAEAGIALAGGHSIDTTEPIFGLSVNGLVPIQNLKKNCTAQAGDLLFITKPIGVGVLTTAQKRGLLNPEHYTPLINQLTTLNKIGVLLGEQESVTAITDITGFGIAGHLIEICEGAAVAARLQYAAIPVLEGVREYLQQRIVPDATYRNWNAVSKKIKFEKGVNVMEAFSLLPDPQTNGGLLFTVKKEAAEHISHLLKEAGITNCLQSIGEITGPGELPVIVY